MTERYSHFSPEHLGGKTEMLTYGQTSGAEVIPFRQIR